MMTTALGSLPDGNTLQWLVSLVRTLTQEWGSEHLVINVPKPWCYLEPFLEATNIVFSTLDDTVNVLVKDGDVVCLSYSVPVSALRKSYRNSCAE